MQKTLIEILHGKVVLKGYPLQVSSHRCCTMQFRKGTGMGANEDRKSN